MIMWRNTYQYPEPMTGEALESALAGGGAGLEWLIIWR